MQNIKNGKPSMTKENIKRMVTINGTLVINTLSSKDTARTKIPRNYNNSFHHSTNNPTLGYCSFKKIKMKGCLT